MFDSIKKISKKLSLAFPLREILRNGGDYLHRRYIVGQYPEKFWDKTVPPRLPNLPFTVYLHRMLTPDGYTEIHNHPFKWSFSIILWGGYTEEREITVGRMDGYGRRQIHQHWAERLTRWKDETCLIYKHPSGLTTAVRRMRSGMVNVITKGTFHRVLELHGKQTWTLFVTGPRSQMWGFKSLQTGKFEPWMHYLQRKDDERATRDRLAAASQAAIDQAGV